MVRNILWLIATAVAIALVLAYPTSANQGVPLGRTPGTASAGKTPSAPLTGHPTGSKSSP